MSGPEAARWERRFRLATRALGEGLDALEAALRSAHLPEAAVLDLRLVAEEVLTNVAAYGYDDAAEHAVALRLTVVGGVVTMEFRDDGRPFDPLAAPPPDLQPPLEARATGGLGVHLIRSLVDAAEYVRSGRENVLTLTRRVSGSGGS
jgi:anti-sigma regulatory factor (Ser/Thr protein kinase)